VSWTWCGLPDYPRAARTLEVLHGLSGPCDAARRRMAALGILRAQTRAFAGGEEIDLACYLPALCDAERRTAPASSGVVLHADLRSVRVAVEVAFRIGLAFCELLRNALTHAFPQDGAGHVGIHLWPTTGLPGVRACLLVADGGRGFGDEPPVTSEHGIPVARYLVERCGGTLTREPGGPGTIWRVKLPAADAELRGHRHPNCQDH